MVRRVETGVDAGAAVAFAAAIGFAAWTALGHRPPDLLALAEALGASALALLLAWRTLGAVRPHAGRSPIAIFDVREIEPAPIDIALPAPAESEGEGPLELDDILAEIGPDARVVRLFDRSAMPTPGQLKTRIDRHLDRDLNGSGGGDQSAEAMAALHEALEELRRSFR